MRRSITRAGSSFDITARVLGVVADQIAGARAVRGERLADHLGDLARLDPGLGRDPPRALAHRLDQSPV